MEALLLKSPLPTKPSFEGLQYQKLGPPLRKRLRGGVAAKAVGPRDQDYGGRPMEESMIILRKRIYELKMSEESSEELPHHWMEWEKRYKASAYDSDVCEAVGLLQTMLMNTRPSLAIGTLSLVILSVPTSVGMILISLAHAVNEIFHGV